MGKRFRRLFDSICIGKVQLKNRIAMAPMGIEYMANPDGGLNLRVVDYYPETDAAMEARERIRAIRGADAEQPTDIGI